ncbi:hypothetical protein ACFOY2_01670 [Nonomuraea purpurea]|uniref:DUF3558 domain-containing protein n=1 Tax=Nonomuraea purpurea TaxID=1849276 RepID=A0ABV8FVZ6_9ACTN
MGIVVVLLAGAVVVAGFVLGAGTGPASTFGEADDESPTSAPPSAKVDLTAFKGEHLCSALAPATLDKLVPEAEENPKDTNYGDEKVVECEWNSGSQEEQRLERNRTLSVELNSFADSKSPERKFAYERKLAEDRPKTNDAFAYDELKDIPGLGEAAFGYTYSTSEGALSNGADLTVRIPGGVVIIKYYGFDRAHGLDGKRSAVSSDTMMDGARTAARKITAAFENDKKAAQYETPTTGDQIRQRPIKNVPDLGDGAFSQVREVKMGSQHSRTGQVWFLTGNRIVEVIYEGSQVRNKPGTETTTTPLDENVVSAYAKVIAASLPKRIAGD